MDFGRASRYETSFMGERVKGNALPKEIEEGNVEYKLKLVDPTPERIEHLVTQLKWRLAEGHGEAMYEIGVADNGELVGLSKRDMEASLNTLRIMGQRLRADVSIIRERVVHGPSTPNQNYASSFKSGQESKKASSSPRPGKRKDSKSKKKAQDDEDSFGFSLDLDDLSLNEKSSAPPSNQATQEDEDDDGTRMVAEVLVRKCLTDDQHFLEVRVAIIGGADAGKSTLLGVLTHTELDNGRGKSRLNLLRHPHEIQTGRTSSISHQIVGFNPRGELINYGSTNVSTWEQICETAAKVVTFLDLCGHPKFQKTTISGLTGHSPDYACLILGANAGVVSDVPREHLGITVALKVPVFIVITKIDVASPEDLARTVTSLLKLLKSPGIRRVPMVIQNEDDLVVAVSSMSNSSVIPIFLVSNVTGENINLLVQFLNLLQKPTKPDDITFSDGVEFAIEETYTVPNAGCVVGGVLSSGTVTANSGRRTIYYLGPDRGRFIPVVISSIHRQRLPVNQLSTGQAATCAITFLVKSDANGELDEDASAVDTNIDISDYEESPTPPNQFKVRKGQVILTEKPQSATRHTISIPASLPYSSSPIIGSPNISTGSPLKTSPSSPNPASASAVPRLAIASASADSVWEVEADLSVLSITPGTTGLVAGSQGVLYIGTVRQGARVVKLRDGAGRWASLVSSNGAPWSASPKRRSMSPSRGGSVSSPNLRRSGSGSSLAKPPTPNPSHFFITNVNSTVSSAANSESLSPSQAAAKLSPHSGAASPNGPSSPKGTKKRLSVSFALPPAAVETPSTEATQSNESLIKQASFLTPPLPPTTPAAAAATAGLQSPSMGNPRSRRASETPSAISPGSPNRRPKSPSVAVSGESGIPSSSSNSIIGSDPPAYLGVGSRGRVRFRFAWEPEWVHIGATVLFRGEGRMKCVGKVVAVVEMDGEDKNIISRGGW